MSSFKEVDVWNESIKMPETVIEAEIRYKEQRLSQFQNIHSSEYDGVAHEPWEGQPHRFFFIRIDDVQYVGSKYISEIVTMHHSPGLFCSKVTKPMILGQLTTFKTSQSGVTVHYRTLTRERLDVTFQRLVDDRGIEISYPFNQLLGADKTEINTPEEGWFVDDERAYLLGLGETHIRKVAAKWLRKHPFVEGAIFYDPACSTGQFLREAQAKVHGSISIGQDISKQMCDYAQPFLDEVHCGNAIVPAVEAGTCDALFLRFINAEVIPYDLSKIMLANLLKCSKTGGLVFMFGHTPTHLTRHDILSSGCELLACNEYDEESDAVFQFYVFQKK